MDIASAGVMPPSRQASLLQTRTQVLIVGAGPVGLLAALRLREQGIDVRVVEQRSELRTHTFPVVLHPLSLRLLDELGLAPTLFWRGRPITRLAIYTDYERRAVLDLPQAKNVSPGALTLPQDILRQALTNAVSQRGVEIEWNTRLAVLQQDGSSVWGRLVRDDAAHLGLSGAARSEVSAFEADFVIGADGYESTVREALGIQLIAHGGLETFAFFDATSERSGSEAQLALSEDFANAVYPIQGGLSRFSFQLSGALNRAPDLSSLRELLLARLPWYREQPGQCEWAGVAEFRRALVDRFGQGRVWLAGEAAHLTGPLGVQSLNVGLAEANELALHMGQQLSRGTALSFGQAYDAERRRQWRQLLGLDEHATPSSRSPSWSVRYLPRILGCLPASERDLDDLLDQLRLTVSSRHPSGQTP
jgi:2-polyprenyl-6-methoxyphenol hydroxylase-like FAD-dependent oxidoreductase